MNFVRPFLASQNKSCWDTRVCKNSRSQSSLFVEFLFFAAFQADAKLSLKVEIFCFLFSFFDPYHLFFLFVLLHFVIVEIFNN